MKKGIIFDMDGTLWDSAKNVAEAWNIAIAKVGYEREPITDQDLYRLMGKTMDVIADNLFPDADDKTKVKLADVCFNIENEYLAEHGGELYPKLRETMEALKEMDYYLYIVSNCQVGYIETFLEYYGFGDLFEDIECYGNNGYQKGDNIALVVKRNNLEDAVYVGDIQGDYDSSVVAGIKFIHAAYGFGEINQVVPKINKLSDLKEMVKEIL